MFFFFFLSVLLPCFSIWAVLHIISSGVDAEIADTTNKHLYLILVLYEVT